MSLSSISERPMVGYWASKLGAGALRVAARCRARWFFNLARRALKFLLRGSWRAVRSRRRAAFIDPTELHTATSASQRVYRARALCVPRSVRRAASRPSSSCETSLELDFVQPSYRLTIPLAGRGLMRDCGKFESVAKAGRKALGTARN